MIVIVRQSNSVICSLPALFATLLFRCSFSNRVSYDGRLTWCDARCLTRCHLASVSDSCHFFRTSQTCRCDGYTSCSCRHAHACSSGTVFVTVTVGGGVAARCRKPTSFAGKHGRSQRRCARTPDPRCTASDKPYTSPVPTAPPESDRRDSDCGSPCEGKFVIVTFSPIAGASALNIAGPQWFTPSFMDDLYCPR